MPLYTLRCENEHTKEVICKYEDLVNHSVCEHSDCQKSMTQEFNMSNKPLVMDRDLMQARNHNGKRY